MPNPYILMPQQAQDMSGLQPVYQNMAAQQQFQNAMAQQGNQLAQQAGQTAGGSGMNPMALAAALRKDKKTGSSGEFGARMDMALNSQANPMLQNEVSQLGSSTWNPLSNYNMGTNGWGNYGE
jgi:hypothetical protein